MSTLHETPGALPAEHHYSGTGKAYWIAWCPDCGVVLNSGHHYRDKAYAWATCAEHNRTHHKEEAK